MRLSRHVGKQEVTIYVVIVLAITLIFTGTVAITHGQSEIVVEYPVNGFLARTAGAHQQLGQLGVADLASKIWTEYGITVGYQTRPFWSKDGQFLAFGIPGAGSSILSMQLNTVQSVPDPNSELAVDPLSDPQGWSQNSQTIIYRSVNLPSDGSINAALYEVEISTNNAQAIYQWHSGQMLTNLPLPPNAISIELSGEGEVERNPVYDKWLLIQLVAAGFYSDTPSSEPLNGNTSVIWNYETSQGFSLDALVPDLYIWPYRSDWNADGTKLLLNAISKDLQDNYILTFHFAPETGVTLIERGTVKGRVAEHWVDAGNVFFSTVEDFQDGDSYFLGEIVEGEYRETLFFTLIGDHFEAPTRSDWFMQADEAERNRLSCLFDRALPTQLVVGDAAQVIADDGVGLRLRAAPDRFSAELQTMAEGTTVTITGGPACSGGYRWWQIELSDGTLGWAAEADASEYFLQLP